MQLEQTQGMDYYEVRTEVGRCRLANEVVVLVFPRNAFLVVFSIPLNIILFVQ